MDDIYRDLENNVPSHTLYSIRMYVEQRLVPGDFLYHVLANDLKRACMYADNMNSRALADIVRYLYNCVPSACWGSPENVENWLAGPPPKTEDSGWESTDDEVL